MFNELISVYFVEFQVFKKDTCYQQLPEWVCKSGTQLYFIIHLQLQICNDYIFPVKMDKNWLFISININGVCEVGTPIGRFLSSSGFFPSNEIILTLSFFGRINQWEKNKWDEICGRNFLFLSFLSLMFKYNNPTKS